MKKLRVLLIAPVPPPYGGIGNWTLLMKRYMADREDAELVNILNTAPKQRAIDGRSLWERVVGQGFEMLKSAKKLKKLIKENKPDVVHITTSGQLAIIRDILFLRICKKKGVRSFYHIRFGRASEIAAANTREWKLFKKAISLSDITVAIDETTEKTLKTYFPDKVIKIPNPFDLAAVDCFEKEEPKKEIMFLGWCVKTKGVEELLEAWSRLVTEYPDWQLRIVGPCEDTYLEELKNKYPCDNVHFDGEKTHGEAMALLNKTGIFVLPSYTEGFPNVILEAMAFGKAMVATDVGAIKEMLCENSGLVVPPQNAEALRDALHRLLKDETLRNTLADNAYVRIRHEYRVDIVFEKYKAAWKGE